MRRVVVLGLGLAIGTLALVAGAETPPPVRFYGVTLGAPFSAGKKFVAADEGAGFRMKKPTAFRGRKPGSATVLVEAGKATGVELAFAATGKAASQKLGKWFDGVCAWLGTKAERHTPSPLGTPTPGEDWDPVITTRGSCDGVVKGVAISAREEQSHASDFQNASVELSASPAAVGR